MYRSLSHVAKTVQKCAAIIPRRQVAHFTFVKDQPDPSLG